MEIEIVFYCPYIAVITIGEIWVIKSYRSAEDFITQEYLIKVRCCISQVEEVLEEIFPTSIFGHDAPYYEFLSDLIIT